MGKLVYKGINFNDFYESQESKYSQDKNPPAELTGIVDVMVYICYECIKKNNLYKEAGMSERAVQYYIDNPYDEDDYKCFVEGCNNVRATEAYLEEEDCKII